MNKEREALRMALEALGILKSCKSIEIWCGAADEAITAIKEALAQSEQEPALQRHNDYMAGFNEGYDRATKQALAQPEQEPLEYWNAVEGWVKIDEVRKHFDSVGCGTIYKTAGEGRAPLYTSPPKREWVGLTDDHLRELGFSTRPRWWAVLEAKLKELNT